MLVSGDKTVKKNKEDISDRHKKQSHMQNLNKVTILHESLGTWHRFWS